MELLNVIEVLEAAVTAESEYVFVLVKTNSSEEMVIIPADKIAEKTTFYEERFDVDGTHKTYPGIALLAASHGDAMENVRLRKEYYGIPAEDSPVIPDDSEDPDGGGLGE